MSPMHSSLGFLTRPVEDSPGASSSAPELARSVESKHGCPGHTESKAEAWTGDSDHHDDAKQMDLEGAFGPVLDHGTQETHDDVPVQKAAHVFRELATSMDAWLLLAVIPAVMTCCFTSISILFANYGG